MHECSYGENSHHCKIKLFTLILFMARGWTLVLILTVPPDDDHWIIDTDYDNYAVHYACRVLDTDGTCLDGYSFIFSRHPNGLRPEDQMIVTQKKQEICLLGKYRRVAHTGKWQFVNATRAS